MLRPRLKTKLVLSFFMIALFILVIGGASYRVQTRLLDIQRTLVASSVPAIRDLQEVRRASLNMLESVLASVLLNAAGIPIGPEHHREAEELKHSSLSLLEAVRRSRSGRHGEEALTAEISALALEFHDRVGHFVEFLQGKAALADILRQREDLERLQNRLDQLITLAVELETGGLSEREELALRAFTKNRYFFLAAVGAVFLSALGLALYLSEIISSPVRALSEAASRVGAGDLTTHVSSDARDELGDLARAFNEMVDHLKATTVSRAFLETILRSMTEGVFVTGEDLQIATVNDAGCEISGYSSDELAAMRLSDLLPGIVSATELRSTSIDDDFRLERKDGGSLAVAMSWASLNDPPAAGGDGGGGFVCVIRNVSAQRRAMAELHHYRERLYRAEQLSVMNSLGAILAHKLNQPLTTVRLFLQQSIRGMDEGAPKEDVAERLSECLEEVTNLATTLSDVLRSVKAAPTEGPVAVELAQSIERCRKLLAPRAQRAGLSVRISGFESLPTVTGIELEVHELFHILMQNAADAAAERGGGKLTISARVEESSLRIDFEDDCGGIAGDRLPTLFDLFFSTKEASRGSGLGLAIAKRIVTNMSGKIEVDSVLGKGSIFSIWLPTVKPKEE